MRGSVELIATEIICLVITFATLLAMIHTSFAADGTRGIPFVRSYVVFVIYLISAVAIHLQVERLLTHPPLLLKGFFFIHILAIPIFILIWFHDTAHQILHSTTKRSILATQIVLVALFCAAAIIDIPASRLFVFSDAGMLVGGNGVKLMLALSAVIAVIALASLLSFRGMLTGFNLFALLLASGMLITSLLFFALFRRPYLFGVVSTFILLISFLAWQRRELTLDPLTKIPNHTAFLNRLRQITFHTREKTIIMIDIENFRLVNDRYGNASGDRVLAAFAAAISSLGSGTFAYRLFSNRFAIVSKRLSHPEIVRVVNTIRTLAGQGWIIDDQRISIHLQFAIVETPFGSNTLEEVTESLEFTMAQIKEQRRLSVIIFNQRLVPILRRRLEILSTLRHAIIDESMVVVHYQPIIDSSDNRIVAAEALMRIVDPHLGVISPAEFIPAAEHTGLIRELTTIVLRKVCALLALHPAASLSHISINISAADMVSPEMGSRLLSIIHESLIEPSKIVFEVTESMLLGSNGQILKNWKLFTEQGVHFMLDDFGTGYSNIESLVTLPFEIVKLDRSVVTNSANDYQLIALIASMLTRLGKQMVAEGVEKRTQLEVAVRHGVHFIQGYYFSRPVEEAQLIEWMEHSMCLVGEDQA